MSVVWLLCGLSVLCVDRGLRAAGPSQHQRCGAGSRPPAQVSRACAARSVLRRPVTTSAPRPRNITFDTLDLAQLADHADVWEKAVRKLRGGMMPPPGVRRPDQAAVDSLVSWLEHSLDQAARSEPESGTRRAAPAQSRRIRQRHRRPARPAHRRQRVPPARRRSGWLRQRRQRAEGVAVVPRPVHLGGPHREHAGDRQSRRPSRPARPTVRREAPIRARTSKACRWARAAGCWSSTCFPADGEYKLNIGGLATAGYVRGMEYRHTLVATIDGAKVFEGQIGGEEDMKAIDQLQAPAVAAINGRFQNIPVKVAAGPHKVGVTFIARSYAESDEVLYAFRPGGGEERIPRVGSAGSRRPVQSGRAQRHAEPQRIFMCHPASAGEELPCATKIMSAFARRAFRRPVTDADLQAPLGFYRTARETGDFDAAIRDGLTAILASPKFLFRAERLPRQRRAGRHLPRQRSRSGVAPVVLPHRPDPGRSAARRGREGPALRSEGARDAGPPAAGRSRVEVAGHQLRVPVAEGARHRRHRSRRGALPQFRRRPARRVPEGDGAVRRQHPARGPQRARSADRGPHVRQRAPGAALRHSRTCAATSSAA